MKCKLILLFFIVINANSQSFHAFLLCKTNDEKISKSVQLNYFTMKNLMEDIAENLEMPYIEHSLTGRNFTERKFNDLFNATKLNSNDIVFVYISTHGKKSLWDKDDFPNVDVPNNIISSYKTFTSCAKLNPKNLIFIVEACSGFSKLDEQKVFLYQVADEDASFKAEIGPKREKDNICKLFIDKNKFIVCAGQPGMDTWATDRGSIFTNSFINAFNFIIKNTDGTAVSWDEILKKAKQDTYAKTKKTSLKHYPIWKKYKDENELVAQSMEQPLNFARFVIDCKKRDFSFLKRNKYKVRLSVITEKPVDSITYYLHHTMPTPTVTLRNDWLYHDFLYTFTIWGLFEIKAVVYFRDGTYQEIFGDIQKNSKTEY